MSTARILCQYCGSNRHTTETHQNREVRYQRPRTQVKTAQEREAALLEELATVRACYAVLENEFKLMRERAYAAEDKFDKLYRQLR